MNTVIPGVYAEERAPQVPGFRLPGTKRGFYIGKFEKGPLVPTLVGLNDAHATFGEAIPGSGMYDVENFIAQGPEMLYVCRAADSEVAATVTIKDQTAVTPVDKLKLTARVAGTWANGTHDVAGVEAVVEEGTLSHTFKLTLNWTYPEADGLAVYTEVYDNLSLDDAAARYFQTYVTAHSQLVVAVDVHPESTADTNLPDPGTYQLAAGAEPDYDDAVAAMDLVRGRLCVFDDSDDAAVTAAILAAVDARAGAYPDITPDASTYIMHPPQYSDLADIVTLAGGGDYRSLMSGTWKMMLDTACDVTRAMRASPILAGLRCRLNPEETVVNKRLYCVLGNERPLTAANLTTLIEGNVCEIYLWPQDETQGYRPVGYFACDGVKEFIQEFKDWVAAIEIAMSGWAVGELQGEADPDPLRSALVGQSTAYWGARKTDGRIDRFLVQCDSKNNLLADIEEGICTKDIEVKAKSPALFIRLRITAGPESSIAREL